ncbi:MAG: efflux RND transporter permease subunit [Alphaproteobacteria bacterium]|nr:efflux RND transporter permease subunit [Alphaproteobacteria bacterium]MBU0796265.1 efflux RND transporter permease subunit [Alphaproteobacteria bacterium]MBU0887476.1 efflux RND transporter permease subunit [Alphaproteobacteria bacterium]MBU1813315.1 efflux RND transporter permease subunit [Alphaproteobacteria bacterium]
MNLIGAAISHARTTLAVLVLILIAGTIAYIDIPKESDPDINIPIIYVSMTHEGISPEDAERLLLRPMEQELKVIEGTKEMRSTAYEGGAFVLLEFDAGFDADTALNDVRERVDIAKSELPDETDEPVVTEVNLSLFPVLVVTLSGPVPERTLVRLARELRDQVESVPSVLNVDITGDREELVEIVIDPLRLESYGLKAEEVLNFISRSNRLIAAGALDTGRGRFPVKVPGLFETTADLLDMPLKTEGDAVVRIRDIGEVRRTFKDRQSIARLDGAPAVGLQISKRTGQNIIETIEAVRAVVEQERQIWPESVTVTYSQDRSKDIRTMLSDLQNNVISAILLVMIIIVGALGLRSAGLVGVSIPGSFLLGILVLHAMGMTINIVVLFALILAVGMLVDGAIVLTEFADRKMTEGFTARQAYARAAKRMAWPIIASTATTLAAFLPLLFWPGVVGEFMKFLPITLLATLSGSLLMALIFVPTLGAFIGKPGGAIDPEKARLLSADRLADNDGDEDTASDLKSVRGPTGIYVRLLDTVLTHPGKMVLAALALLIGVQWYYATHGHGVEFFPEVEPDQAQIVIHARGNLSIDEKTQIAVQIEREILAIDAFDSVYSAIGTQPRGGTERPEDVIAVITVEFKDWQLRPNADSILARIVEKSRAYPGIFVESQKMEAGPPVGKPVALELSSIDPALLNPAAALIHAKFEAMEGLTNIEDSRPVPGIQWAIDVDRAQASKFGIDIGLIGDYVRLITNGLKVTEYRPDDSDDEIDIVVRFPEAYRTLDQFGKLRIQTDAGLVPISNFITERPEPKVGELKRVDGRRIASVKADILPGVLADDKVRELRQWLPESGLDPGIRVTFKGEDREQAEAQAFLVRAFGVALFLMAIILVTQFNSFYSAFLILSAVILSTIGVMIGLLVMNMPFGIVMSGVGVIALAGIVVNNNIILIDTYDIMRQKGVPAHEALLRTGAQRLRPVFLTTATTILGLLPMLFQVNIDFVSRSFNIGAPSTQWWVQLSAAIVFGLAFATVLTLLITPAALKLRANVADWRQRRRERRLDAAPQPAE